MPKNLDEIFEIYISKFSQKVKKSVIKLTKQKSVDNLFGEFSVTKVKDWWLTLVDDHSEVCLFIPRFKKRMHCYNIGKKYLLRLHSFRF